MGYCSTIESVIFQALWMLDFTLPFPAWSVILLLNKNESKPKQFKVLCIFTENKADMTFPAEITANNYIVYNLQLV